MTAKSLCNWRRLCTVDGVTTELLGLDATAGPALLQAVVFPGNPGSAAYFRPFMAALHAQLGGRADVLAVTHAGHDPDIDTGGRLWDLSQQIAHKVAFLRSHVLLPGRPPVILIGHSIGAAMAIKAVAELEGLRGGAPSAQQPYPLAEGAPEPASAAAAAEAGAGGPGGAAGADAELPPILKLVAVFPFFETNFRGNARQRQLRSLAPWHEALGWVGAAVTSLPAPLRTAFVRLNAAMDRDAVELTSRLLSRHIVRNAFYLATHEFKELSQPWDWDLMAALGRRLHVMGCEEDTWMSRQQYDDMCARLPGLQATWHPDLRHAFCVSDRQSAAVAAAIAAIAQPLLDGAAPQAAAAAADAAAATATAAGGAGAACMPPAWGSGRSVAPATTPSAVSVSHATDTDTDAGLSASGPPSPCGPARAAAGTGGLDTVPRVRTSVKRCAAEPPCGEGSAEPQRHKQRRQEASHATGERSTGRDSGDGGGHRAEGIVGEVDTAGPGSGSEGTGGDVSSTFDQSGAAAACEQPRRKSRRRLEPGAGGDAGPEGKSARGAGAARTAGPAAVTAVAVVADGRGASGVVTRSRARRQAATEGSADTR